MDLSIIVVSYNTRELLERCLGSVSSHSSELHTKTIVVDNAFEDGSADIVQRCLPANLEMS